MVRLTSNRILMAAILLVAGYWLILPQLVGFANALVSSFLIMAGIFVLGSWGGDALRAAWSGVVRGPQLALIGVATVALGSVIAGVFSVTWWWNGEPMSWLNTPTSSFGRYVMALGFLTQYFSEDFTITRFKTPKIWFLVVAVLVSLALGVTIGYLYGSEILVVPSASASGHN